MDKPKPQPAPAKANPADAPDTYEALEAATRSDSGLFGRMNARFQEALQNNRGTGQQRSAAEEAGDDPRVTADDIAIRRARTVKPQRMIVPEGVIIDGSMTSGSETEISGRVEGDVTVEGRLYLSPSALITGNVRATTCKVEGLVEGRMECSDQIELGKSGRLNADALAGRAILLEGQVYGNIKCGGRLQIGPSARVVGDIRTKKIVIEEGAMFNGACTMQTPAQRGQKGG
jgi:cytoskeletal protein CcmA (bactofilin family)